ncbi:MAG: hypothetical protein CMJ65_11325 [Planctomycetaceae bacterium]|jgi:hypothetical protein|nr:hypothetical protein [Planctomycetaceae bacterium]
MTDSTTPEQIENSAPKVHPSTRQLESGDPLELLAHEVEGDPELMLRLIVEEFARMGVGTDTMMQWARQPFYVGLHGLWRLYGEDGLRQRIQMVTDSCGIMRFTHKEMTPPPLVPLDLPDPERVTKRHA